MDTFDRFIINAILANNKFQIIEVNDIHYIKSMFFIQEQYSNIVALIKNQNLDEIINLSSGTKSSDNEYLEIVRFTDQNQNVFFVTVYDNDSLE